MCMTKKSWRSFSTNMDGAGGCTQSGSIPILRPCQGGSMFMPSACLSGRTRHEAKEALPRNQGRPRIGQIPPTSQTRYDHSLLRVCASYQRPQDPERDHNHMSVQCDIAHLAIRKQTLMRELDEVRHEIKTQCAGPDLPFAVEIDEIGR